MKFNQIPINTFETMQLNAGIFVKNFDPATGEFKKEDIMGATSGGANFSAVPTFSDRGEGIDNCPKNTMELMNLDNWEVKMSGTYKTLSKSNIVQGLGSADIDPDDDTHIIPRRTLKQTDFYDMWWVGDYAENGFMAIHMYNLLNTNGFSFQSTDNGTGSFPFEYTCHFSQKDVDKLPFDIYVSEGATTPVTPKSPDSGTDTQQANEATTFKATRSKLNTATEE